MSNLPYKNPISPIQSLGTLSVGRNATFGTNFSVLGVGGFMEVYNLSDLDYTIPNGQSGIIEFTGNTIPIQFKKGSGSVYSPDVLTLNSDNISSGRRRLGMLVYVYETDKIYQYTIRNYDSLWSGATGATGPGGQTVVVSDFGTTVKNNSVEGQNFINSWTASTVEGVNGFTSSDATWKILNFSGASGAYVPLAGGTMTGKLYNEVGIVVTGEVISDSIVVTNITAGTISATSIHIETSADISVGTLTAETYSGTTIVVNNFTAITVSATTYLNLPNSADTKVTGFSLNNNVITLSQNTNDQYSAFTISLSAYTGGTSVSGNYLPLSGGTLSGPVTFQSGLTANTISATTYFNLPTTSDTFVTGFSLTNNTITLSQNRNDQYSAFTISLSAFTGNTNIISNDYLSLSGGTVTGGTNFQSGLTANTISATTYLNLPVTADTYVTGFTFDVSNYNLTIGQNNGQSALTQSLSILASDLTVTGGTYNSNTGTATFTNNTGGTFQVTGFLTGFTDTLVTGFSYNNNTFTINDSRGSAFTASINTMTGLTSTTISATTYYNLPVTADTFVTGFSLNNNLITLSQNRNDQYSAFTVSLSAYTGNTSSGNDGASSGRWTLDNTTNPPNSGYFYTTATTFTGLTNLIISLTANTNTDYSAWLTNLYTNYANGQQTFLQIQEVGNNSNIGIYQFNGSYPPVSAITLSNLIGNGSFVNGANYTISTVSNGAVGPTGPQGIDGANSGRWTFTNSSTAFSDPGSSNFNSDSSDFSLVTAISISYEDYVSTNLYGWLSALTLNQSSGYTPILQIKNISSVNEFGTYTVGTIVDNTTWFDLPLTLISSNSSLNNGSIYSISWVLNGKNAAGGGTNPTNDYIPVNSGGTFADSFLNQSANILKTIYSGTDTGLKLDFPNKIFIFGDFADINSGVTFVVDGTIGSREITANHDGSTDGFDLQLSAKVYDFGNLTNGNSTKISIDDNAKTITLTNLTSSTDNNVVTIDGTGILHTYPLSGLTGGTSVSGDYLPLSGGTVTGNTYFTSGLSANTLYVTGLTQTSGITSTGGITFKQVTINSSYTATTSDYMIDVTGGTFSVTLPSAVGIQGRLLVVKNNGGGAVTVQPILGQTIDDKPFVILGETNAIQLASNGSNWVTISYNISTVNSSTGVFEFSGLSIASTTTFNVAPVKGWVVDDTTNPLSPQLYYVYYSGGTHTATYVNTATETWVYLTSGGTIQQSNIALTEQQRRQNIFLGKLGHANLTNIINAFSQPDFVLSPLSQLRDMFTPINLINGGIYASPNGANLSFNTSANYLYGLGINFANSTLTPNALYVTGTNPCTFQYRTQTGGTASNTTLIDPLNYDVGGAITPITGTKATNQRIYLVQNGVFRVQYGQQTYNTLAAAIAGLATEQYNTFSNFTNNGILIGVLSVLSTATDLSDSSKAQFFFASKFGETVGSAGGVSTTNLQQAYNNSVNPEILTNSTLGALHIKNGDGPDTTATIIEGSDSSGTTTSIIYANGRISGTTLFTKGFTASTNGLSATTISATTYYGLPTYISATTLSSANVLSVTAGGGSPTTYTVNAVTGGSYSNGTITLSGTGNFASTITGFNTGTITGSGTSGYLSKFTSTTAIGDSGFYDNGSGTYGSYGTTGGPANAFVAVRNLAAVTTNYTGGSVGSYVRVGFNTPYTGNSTGVIEARSAGGTSTSPLSLNHQGGNVIIGSLTDGGYKLDVNGTTRITNTLTVTATTDPVKFVGLQGASDTSVLTVDGTGVVHTIAASSLGGGGLTWNNATTTQAMSVNNGYITTATTPTVTVFTLPSAAALGSAVEIAGAATGLWQLNVNAGQTIRFGNVVTTATTSALSATSQGDCVRMICTSANTTFIVVSSMGNIFFN